MITLYHYPHCPYCIRVRLALGYLNIDYKSVVLSYDDEATPKKLTGKKMLPIATIDDKHINESLNIIYTLDVKQKFALGSISNDQEFSEVENLIKLLGDQVYPLSMPQWIHQDGWTAEAKKYFQEQKERNYITFESMRNNQKQYLRNLKPILATLEKTLCPFYKSEDFSFYDILLASHLWSLYIVPEFSFSEKLDDYLKTIAKTCHFSD